MRTLFFYIAIVIFQVSFAQDYSNLLFETISSNNGLISDEVRTVDQDEQGFLWFGTKEGISRYDGYELKTFKENPVLGKLYGVDISIIERDNNGNVFIGTPSGLQAYNNNDGAQKLRSFKKLQGRKINDLLFDGKHTLYIASESGLFTYDTLNDTTIAIPAKRTNGLYSSNIKALLQDSKKQIWVASWGGGLSLLNPVNNKFTTYLNFLNPDHDKSRHNNCYSLFEDKYGYIWVGTWESGVFVMDFSNLASPKKIKHFVTNSEDPNSILGNIIYSIQTDKYDNYWLGTPYGLSILEDAFSPVPKFNNYIFDGSQFSVSNNEIFKIYKDQADIMWLATSGGGINKVFIDRLKFRSYQITDVDPQIKSQTIYCFTQYEKNKILLGVMGLGIIVYDTKTNTYSSAKEIPVFKNMLSQVILNAAKAFFWDNENTLWIGSRYKGVIRLNTQTGEYKNFSQTFNNFSGREIYDIFKDSSQRIWVGSNTGLDVLKSEKDLSFKNYNLNQLGENTSDNTTVTSITQLSNGKIWLGTLGKGVVEVSETEKGITFTEKNKFSSPEYTTLNIHDVFEDSKKNVWIATKGKGLLLWDQKYQLFYNPFQEKTATGDIVFNIEEDTNHNLWVTTNSGISKILRTSEGFKTELFAKNDGLQGNIFNLGAFYKDKNNLFYSGGFQGFNIFNPSDIKSNIYIAPVVISQVQFSGKDISPANYHNQTIKLPYSENNFTVSFAALSYANPEKNQYAYMLEGVDDTWRYANSSVRMATYAQLRPNTYRFFVKAANSQGIWNPEPATISFIIKPAPFKTWYAYTFYVLIIMGLIFLFYRMMLKNEKIKQDLKMEHLERLRSDNLNQFKLSFFTNISHELLTPLSIVSFAIDNWKKSNGKKELKVNIIENNVNNLIRLIRQLLHFRKMETGNMVLKVTDGNISAFTNEIFENFMLLAEKKQINFSIDVQENIRGYYDREKVEIILHNLLSNAFKYTRSGGLISATVSSVILNKNIPGVQFEITDNGVGIDEENLENIFERFYRVGDDKMNNDGIGIGLNLTKNLVNLHNGTIEVQSVKGEGTSFTVKLPIIALSSSISLNHEHDQKTKPTPISDQNATQLTPTTTESEPSLKKTKTILLVEDNEDFRLVLRDALKDEFLIEEAPNGEEGLKIALSRHIDLIVSDIMMPILDGIELCKRVKEDLNLSHIPIILLSAKVDDKHKISGYSSGADSYLEKPVNTVLLKARIKSIIKQRTDLQTKFNTGFSLEPENLEITTLDEKFITKAKEIVEANLSNTDLSVKTLCAELGTSNSMLYRKIKGLLDMTPNEFIRNIRLKRASQMLENGGGGINISEVVYNCGFSDLSYFGVCFKKQYGVTPSAFLKGERKY